MTGAPPRALSDARASVMGFAAGLLNGLIALGGGIVITPGLVVYGRASPEVAVGTSLGAVVVLSSVAFLMHASFGGLGLGVPGILAVVAAGVDEAAGGREAEYDAERDAQLPDALDAAHVGEVLLEVHRRLPQAGHQHVGGDRSE